MARPSAISAESALETKYRDIADGNNGDTSGFKLVAKWLETKYRDIADGNFAINAF